MNVFTIGSAKRWASKYKYFYFFYSNII